jgi:ATP-dependent RNA helicase SUPV3L1/SUV3
MEVFYTFTWAPRRQGGGARGPRRVAEGGKPGAEGGRPRAEGGRPKGKGGKPPRGKGGKPPRDETPKTFTARPERKKDRIDPDNPFAQALAGLRDKT